MIVILLVIILLVPGLFVFYDRLDLPALLTDTSPLPSGKDSSEQSVGSGPVEIVATPGMIEQAARELQTEKLRELESTENILPTDRFFYVVELQNGDDLEAVELTIEPDYVTLLSAGGTSTTIDRASVKKVHRYKLSPAPVAK